MWSALYGQTLTQTIKGTVIDAESEFTLPGANIISLDIQNVTNRLNIGGQYYDSYTAELVTWRQTGLLPILNYKLEF